MRKSIKSLDNIEFEVEHPLYLARIINGESGERAKVMLNEFERREVPIYMVAVAYLPKFDKVAMDGGSITDPKQAYRVLYETHIFVGMSPMTEEIVALNAKAKQIAENVPDPGKYRGEFI